MKLSEQLQQDSACGDYGTGLEGYAERAEALEEAAFTGWYREARECGANSDAAIEYANKRLAEI